MKTKEKEQRIVICPHCGSENVEILPDGSYRCADCYEEID